MAKDQVREHFMDHSSNFGFSFNFGNKPARALEPGNDIFRFMFLRNCRGSYVENIQH